MTGTALEPLAGVIVSCVRHMVRGGSSLARVGCKHNEEMREQFKRRFRHLVGYTQVAENPCVHTCAA